MILQEIFSLISGFIRAHQKDLYLIFFSWCHYLHVPPNFYVTFCRKICVPPPPTPYPGDVIFEQPFIKYYLKNVLV